MFKYDLFPKVQLLVGDSKEDDLMYHLALSIFTGKDYIPYRDQKVKLTWWGYDPDEKMLFEFNTEESVYDTALIDILLNAVKLCEKNRVYFIGPRTKVLTEKIMFTTLRILDFKCDESVYTFKTLE